MPPEVVEAAARLREDAAEPASTLDGPERVPMPRRFASRHAGPEAIGEASVQPVREVMNEQAYTSTVARLEQALTAVHT